MQTSRQKKTFFEALSNYNPRGHRLPPPPPAPGAACMNPNNAAAYIIIGPTNFGEVWGRMIHSKWPLSEELKAKSRNLQTLVFNDHLIASPIKPYQPHKMGIFDSNIGKG